MRQATTSAHGFRALSTLLVALASAVGVLALVMAVGPNWTRESRNPQPLGLIFQARIVEGDASVELLIA